MKKRMTVLFLVVIALLVAAGSFSGCDRNVKGLANPPEAVGETVTFGQWRGNPIEWRVLDIKDGKALLITEDIVAIRQYDGLAEYDDITANGFKWRNTRDIKVTWEDSDIRVWLNGEFIGKAFSKGEKNSILISDIKNSDNEEYGTDGGNDTEDRVFLLSIDEAKEYFNSDDVRLANYEWTKEDKEYVLKIAKEDRGYTAAELKTSEKSLDDTIKEGPAPRWWFLRSPGCFEGDVAVVANWGSVDSFGMNVSDVGGVRPAIWVKL